MNQYALYVCSMAVVWTAAVVMGYYRMEYSGWALAAAVVLTFNYPGN